MSFLDGLGLLLRLKDSQEKSVYVGGLDLDGEDGDFTYYWQDEFVQGMEVYFPAKREYLEYVSTSCVSDVQSVMFQ